MEAAKRGLKCGVSQTNGTGRSLQNWNNTEICNLATEKSSEGLKVWAQHSSFIPHIVEAVHRGLTVELMCQ